MYANITTIDFTAPFFEKYSLCAGTFYQVSIPEQRRHCTVGWAIYWDCDLGQEKMSRRVAKILPTPSTSGMMSKTMGNHQKFATALDIYFWTSKHEKLAKNA